MGNGTQNLWIKSLARIYHLGYSPLARMSDSNYGSCDQLNLGNISLQIFVMILRKSPRPIPYWKEVYIGAQDLNDNEGPLVKKSIAIWGRPIHRKRNLYAPKWLSLCKLRDHSSYTPSSTACIFWAWQYSLATDVLGVNPETYSLSLFPRPSGPPLALLVLHVVNVDMFLGWIILFMLLFYFLTSHI